MKLPDSERVLASAVRFLIDGNQHDLASILLTCTLRADKLITYNGGTYGLVYSLIGPRVFYDLLKSSDSFMPDETDMKKYAVERELKEAINAVLPGGVHVAELYPRCELVDIEPNWKQELLEIARGQDVHNQAVEAQKGLTWLNLRFRSHSEIRIAQALENKKVLYFPNCKARLGISTREAREPDFLVCDKGKWGVLEVDGEPFHPPSRTVQDHDRDRLFKAHGIKVVEHFDAAECFENADKVVEKFLYILRQS